MPTETFSRYVAMFIPVLKTRVPEIIINESDDKCAVAFTYNSKVVMIVDHPAISSAVGDGIAKYHKMLSANAKLQQVFAFSSSNESDDTYKNNVVALSNTICHSLLSISVAELIETFTMAEKVGDVKIIKK